MNTKRIAMETFNNLEVIYCENVHAWEAWLAKNYRRHEVSFLRYPGSYTLLVRVIGFSPDQNCVGKNQCSCISIVA